MSIEFKLPDLGENISSAGVLAVLVKPGDKIQANTPVLEIETDKATIEVPSSVAGTVTSVLVAPGDLAKVGQVVLRLEQIAASASPTVAEGLPKAPLQPVTASPTQQQQVKLPDLGENITSATVLQVLVAVGDSVTADTPMVELETDKATIEVPVGQAGRVEKLLVAAGEKAEVGQVLLHLSGSSVPVEERKATAPVTPPIDRKQAPQPPANGSRGSVAPPAVNPSPSKPDKSAAASPTVRRLAREIGVDINAVRGSGPKGRISHEDVKAQARALLKRGTAATAPVNLANRPAYLPLPDFTQFGSVEREAMSTIRRKTAETMAQAWSTIPMVTQFDKADITDVETLRKKLDPKAQKLGGKLTVTAILMKVCAAALKRFPKFNASLDLLKEEVVYKKYLNVGVAVDTERGLLVPVVRDVASKNILELSVELQGLAEKARNRKVTPQDLQGSCFTITNLGGIGGTAFTPIVNPPEVAILGVSRGQLEPVWQQDQWIPRQMLPLSLSYDHRLIDGAEAARFLRFICEALETPALLLFEG